MEMFSKCVVVTKVSLEKENPISVPVSSESCDLCREMGIDLCLHQRNG